MDVKEATHIARDYITAVFADTEIAQLGPEEAVSDPDTGQWRITCGFRPPLVPAWVLIADGAESAADCKVVAIADGDRRVISLTGRLMPEQVRC